MCLLLRYAAVMIFFTPVASTAQTEIRHLSGHGKDDPIQWEFKSNNGRNSGRRSTIPVPSNWELQGFGVYTYGNVKRDGGFPRVHGVYKRTFTIPASWSGKIIFINFEGVMTDAQVIINGNSAGPMHQGGYYAFKYDITTLLKPPGQKNEIEVGVDDESANESVNRAERRGDFWNYGGIFRPVFLEAVPKTFIDHLAVNATAAGSLDVDIKIVDKRASLAANPVNVSLEMQVIGNNGKPAGAVIKANRIDLNAITHLRGTIANPRLWNAETPNLYELEVRLKSGNVVVHSVRQRFGFRTIEVRPGQGLFVNGRRVFLKGVARHSFWPDSGRTLSAQVSRDDINLIKEMNGNAVRSSHYPPDRHFLDACDELGLYVLDELAGWQAHYDTDIGRKLVKEMVEHDVNHPSILFWDNGNEGGFNFDLDGDYVKYDPSKRIVLHPWAAYPPGIADTKHYPNYETLIQKLNNDPVFFPTEMLHGLYDGGAGAGMQDYWNAISKSKAGAGGFVWAFLDEDVKRTDKGGILDSQGNMAPDGIVGPYREREPSFYAIKEIWSPIIVTPSDVVSRSFTVTNRYTFLNANQCTYEWQLIAFRRPNNGASGSIVLTSHIDHGRSLAPGSTSRWQNWGPQSSVTNLGAKRTADATRLIIRDVTDRVIQTYVWPIDGFETRLSNFDQPMHGGKSVASESDETIRAAAGNLSILISKTTGLLLSASRQEKVFSLSNGPRVVAMGPRSNSVPAPDSKLTSINQHQDGRDLIISVTFGGPMKSLTYRLKPSGWLSIDYDYKLQGAEEYFGIGFDYPEANVRGMRYLGDGPIPVYQNRLAGGFLDVWDRSYNDSVVGDPDQLNPGQHFDYPPFKGFYRDVRWVRLSTSEGPITAMIDQNRDQPTYVQIFTPKTPPGNLAGNTLVPFPTASISFLQAIPAMGNKFAPPTSMGPMSQLSIAKGEYNGHINIYFGSTRAQ